MYPGEIRLSLCGQSAHGSKNLLWRGPWRHRENQVVNELCRPTNSADRSRVLPPVGHKIQVPIQYNLFLEIFDRDPVAVVHLNAQFTVASDVSQMSCDPSETPCPSADFHHDFRYTPHRQHNVLPLSRRQRRAPPAPVAGDVQKRAAPA